MRMSDSALGWFLALTAMLLVVAVLLMVLRSRLGRAKSEDSWERTEERRRRKETVYGSASYVLLFCCAAVAGALSFHGLVGFGVENLGLSGGWEYLVPFGLDGAAMFCSVLAVREASHGDAALGSRSLVWTFAAASAWFNWVHAPRGIDHNGAPQFFAGMSLSAAILFDRALKQTRKAALREQGLVPRPLPQIRVVRWLRAPRETYAAWSLMLLENVRSLDEAVDEVREDRRTKLRERDARRSAPAEPLRALGSGGPGGNGGAVRGRMPQLPRPGLRESNSGEPAIVASPEAQSGGVYDLTAEDDTVTMQRPNAWDSLEQKLKDLEQQYG